MARTKTGTTRRARHNKVLGLTKGFRGTNSRLYKRAHEALLHSGQYAYEGRKLRKRDMRRLWITRIGIALRALDEKFQYSRFVNALLKANVALNRKMLAELAVTDSATFAAIVKKVL